MTHRRDSNAHRADLALDDMHEMVDLLESAENPFAAMLSYLMNRAMKFERTKHLCAGHHERTAERNGYANRYKDRSLKTRLGKLELRVPQVRDSHEPFYPESLNAAMASERALRIALAELYGQGVATRKGEACLEDVVWFWHLRYGCQPGSKGSG